MQKANELIKELKAAGIRVKYDDNDNTRPGWKFAEYELKGVPVRLALGCVILKIMCGGGPPRYKRKKTGFN